MDTRKAFALGSFHFAFVKNFPIHIKEHAYVEKLKELLSKVENVEDIKIIHKPRFDSESKIKKAISLSDGDIPLPFPRRLDLSFDLFIPNRFQNEIYKDYKCKLRTYSEHFNIRLIYRYYFPICIIETKSPSEFPHPSDAIPIIYSFLKERISSIDAQFELQRIGPSPFHTDFYLYDYKPEDIPNGKTNDDIHWQFKTEIKRRWGYDLMTFYYNPDEFTTIEDAQDRLYHQLSEEISIYYFIESSYRRTRRKWITISKLSDDLFKRSENNLLLKIVNRFYRDGALIEKVIVKLAEFETRLVNQREIIQSAYSNIFEIDYPVFMQSYVKDLIDNSEKFPTNEIRDIVRFFDSLRSRLLNSVAVLISAILGGAVGALLTIMLSKQ